ncbi:uncharacterized protein J4E88_007706 [Alternaria novae-zelandiae]|uniref:uncharacterized protein n=1 Tax=Alternaria novae-zelandiae TaxID=430562 RepID=UPI0020C2B560|nr:uncharacterized protein J4E88_007706 [Alternaria novae-zelandiae]KAI4675672.1 hypothetical protein J4E88_007706 [Alternaria novae-zelandiae]KAI4707359.1 hypothetical protein J4E89_007886 [Alternaria sp. Ai002NY15]
MSCFTRGYVVKKFGLDDLFIAIAVTLGAAQTVTIILQIEHGQGRHASELHVEQFDEMLMYQWINMLIYFVANWAVKMSILSLYYRIGYGKQGLPWIVQSPAVWTAAGFMTAFSFSVFLAQLFICTPVSRVWDIEAQPDGCINAAMFMVISGAINVVTDIVLLIFPLPLIWVIKFNKRQRTALAVILSIGVIPVIASTMRLCEIVMSDSPIRPGSTWQEVDFSWGWSWVPVWSQIEVDIGILAASLPSLSPLLKHVFHCPARATTPSEVPTLPGYRGSWGEKNLVSMDDEDDIEKSPWDFALPEEKNGAFDFDVERRLTVTEIEMGKAMDMGNSYFDDTASEVEERESAVLISC